MSFIWGNRSSFSYGAPDEDYVGREVQCTTVDGDVVGTAILVELVAAAGYAQVYRCCFNSGPLEGSEAAAKILTTGYAHSAARAEPLLKRLYDREVGALSSITHPNVIKLYGVGEVSVIPTSLQNSPGDPLPHAESISSFCMGQDEVSTPTRARAAQGAAFTDGSSSVGWQRRPSTPGSSHGGAHSVHSPSNHATGSNNHHAPHLSDTGVAAFRQPVGLSRFGGRQSANDGLGVGATEASNSTTSSKDSMDCDALLDDGPATVAAPANFKRCSLPAPIRVMNTTMRAAPESYSPLRSADGSPAPGRSPVNELLAHASVGVSHHQHSSALDESSTPQLESRSSLTPPAYVHPSLLFAKVPASYQAGCSFLGRQGPFKPGNLYQGSSSMSRPGSIAGNGNTKRRVVFMEWMDGGDARKLMDTAMQPFSEHFAAGFIALLAQALDAAHSAGFVHRDIKAGNILLSHGPKAVCLADWGIAVEEEECSSRTSCNGIARQPGTVGTQFWCAPELELGFNHDSKSDVFSLAITFIELITSKDPKYDNSSLEAYRLITSQEQGIIPPHVSEEARSWLVSCLAVEPSQRPSAHDLLQLPYFLNALQRLDAQERQMVEEDNSDDDLLIPAATGHVGEPDHDDMDRIGVGLQCRDSVADEGAGEMEGHSSTTAAQVAAHEIIGRFTDPQLSSTGPAEVSQPVYRAGSEPTAADIGMNKKRMLAAVDVDGKGHDKQGPGQRGKHRNDDERVQEAGCMRLRSGEQGACGCTIS